MEGRGGSVGGTADRQAIPRHSPDQRAVPAACLRPALPRVAVRDRPVTPDLRQEPGAGRRPPGSVRGQENAFPYRDRQIRAFQRVTGNPNAKKYCRTPPMAIFGKKRKSVSPHHAYLAFRPAITAFDQKRLAWISEQIKNKTKSIAAAPRRRNPAPGKRGGKARASGF